MSNGMAVTVAMRPSARRAVSWKCRWNPTPARAICCRRSGSNDGTQPRVKRVGWSYWLAADLYSSFEEEPLYRVAHVIDRKFERNESSFRLVAIRLVRDWGRVAMK